MLEDAGPRARAFSSKRTTLQEAQQHDDSRKQSCIIHLKFAKKAELMCYHHIHQTLVTMRGGGCVNHGHPFTTFMCVLAWHTLKICTEFRPRHPNKAGKETNKQIFRKKRDSGSGELNPSKGNFGVSNFTSFHFPFVFEK